MRKFPKQISKMSWVFDALYAAGHKPFDLAIERLVALLRVTLTLFCFVDFITAPGLQHYDRSQFVLVLVAYTVFGIIVAWLPTIGKVRTGWQLPVHVIDIGVISYLMYFLQSLSSTFFVLYVFVLLNSTFRWNWQGAVWTTILVFALEVILFSTGSMVSQFLIQCAFLFIVGGMFAFFGVGRERGADRLKQIAAWPNIRVQSQRISIVIGSVTVSRTSPPCCRYRESSWYGKLWRSRTHLLRHGLAKRSSKIASPEMFLET